MEANLVTVVPFWPTRHLYPPPMSWPSLVGQLLDGESEERVHDDRHEGHEPEVEEEA